MKDLIENIEKDQENDLEKEVKEIGLESTEYRRRIILSKFPFQFTME